MEKEALEKLKVWFLENRRDFPWRKEKTPYRVWISEVMLQQTRASVVSEYFERWMKKFPDVGSLAKASLEEVIKMWEGLGYYQRVRFLHQGAKKIVEEYGGKIPSTKEELDKIPGIGAYTRGAILAFGFEKKAAAVDGNVLRVLSRYYLLLDDISKESAKRKAHQIEESFLPDKEPWMITEAMIELGSTLCFSLLCNQCPLKESCLAFLEKKQTFFPMKSKKQKSIELSRYVLILKKGKKFFLQKRKKGLMEDLYEFLYFDEEEEKINIFLDSLKKEKKFQKKLPCCLQSFTKYRVTLFPFVYEIFENIQEEGFWFSLDEMKTLAFSSGHRKILEKLKEE